MSKMGDMAQTIEELRYAAAAISDAADWLTKMFSEDPELTLEEVRAVLAEKSREGFTVQVRELLRKYGANKLSEVDPKNYKALAADAGVLGNG